MLAVDCMFVQSLLEIDFLNEAVAVICSLFLALCHFTEVCDCASVGPCLYICLYVCIEFWCFVIVLTSIAIFAGIVCKAAAISNCGRGCINWERQNT